VTHPIQFKDTLPESLNDVAFEQGQHERAKDLGDGKQVGSEFHLGWLPEFEGVIHGVIIVRHLSISSSQNILPNFDGELQVAGDTRTSIDAVETTLSQLLGSSITEVYKVSGAARPGAEKGREHFGYMDGISEPAVDGIVAPLPGQPVIRPGVLLIGRDGDTVQRPDWALDGSILVYRHLEQKVPEFDEFKRKHALPADTPEEGAELLGARLVGRWKSGESLWLLQWV
jgi:Dyp-type peroxidase family